MRSARAEVVAIMGAHSLGRAQFINSGIEGGWITSQSSFTNLYYQAMVRRSARACASPLRLGLERARRRVPVRSA